MNPTPTDQQWLVLHMIDDGDVWREGNLWIAATEHGRVNVSGRVWRLIRLGLVDVKDDKLVIHPEGFDVLKRRSVYDVLERLNRRAESRANKGVPPGF
jgi:transcriptional regulator of nitric oxide reductase